MAYIKLDNPFNRPNPFHKKSFTQQLIPNHIQQPSIQHFRNTMSSKYRQKQQQDRKNKFNPIYSFIKNIHYHPSDFERFLMTNKKKQTKNKQYNKSYGSQPTNKSVENPFHRKSLLMNQSDLMDQVESEITIASYKGSNKKYNNSPENNYQPKLPPSDFTNYVNPLLDQLQLQRLSLSLIKDTDNDSFANIKPNPFNSKNIVSPMVQNLINESVKYPSNRPQQPNKKYIKDGGKQKIRVNGKQYYRANLGYL